VFPLIWRRWNRSHRSIAATGLSDRVTTASGDFFTDPLPKADVITMGMILHDWNLERKKQLIRAAYEALPAGGAFVAIEALIDDARREKPFWSAHVAQHADRVRRRFDYSGADFQSWCREAGFQRFEVIHLVGPQAQRSRSSESAGRKMVSQGEKWDRI